MLIRSSAVVNAEEESTYTFIPLIAVAERDVAKMRTGLETVLPLVGTHA